MSCNTAYLISEKPGRWHARWDKYGTWQLADPAAALALVRDPALRARGRDGLWECRGVAIDVPGRRFRFHGCRHERGDVVALESIEDAVRAAWAAHGWDAAYAWHGADDLIAILPADAAVVIDRDDREAATTLAPRDDWFLGWDPASYTLRARQWAGPWDYDSLLSIVGSDRRILDFGVCAAGALDLLVDGPAVLDRLAAEPPYPVQDDLDVRRGAIVDAGARRIRYWEAITSAARRAAVAAAWPGWTIERLRGGLAAHLADTRRAGTPPTLDLIDDHAG